MNDSVSLTGQWGISSISGPRRVPIVHVSVSLMRAISIYERQHLSRFKVLQERSFYLRRQHA